MSLTPDQIDVIANEYLVDLFQEMEQDALADIARRVRKTGRLTETAELMAQNLQRYGYSPSQIQAQVMREIGADRDLQEAILRNTMEYKEHVAEVIKDITNQARLSGNAMVANAGMMCFNDDLSLWKSARKKVENTMLPQIVQAIQKQTLGTMQNITRTTALGLRDSSGVNIPIMDAYRRMQDKALLQVATGTFSYDEAVNRVVREMAKSGVRMVEYNSKSGRTTMTELDVAVRRNVRTGLSQMAGKVMEENLRNSDTDLVITSQHVGSRPEHAEWQNRIFSFSGKSKRYPSLEEGTGYGTVTGLKGANCTHNFYPYWPGISVKQPDIKEPPPVEINGRTYTYYQATQRQRAYERELRSLKREALIQENSGGDPAKISELRSKAREVSKEYNSFSKSAGLKPKPNRARVAGFGGSRSPDITDKSSMPRLPKATSPKPDTKIPTSKPNIKVTAQEASDDWFEYEKASAMSEYIRTGKMPTEDIYGGKISREDAAKLQKEAELIQEIGEKTNTKHNTVYRGMVMDLEDVRALTPGDTYLFETLSATSPVKDIAMIYTNTENSYIEDGVPVILEIQKSGGIYGFKRDDAEVVLPRGASFKITRNYMDENGVVHVSLYASKKK